MLQYYFSLRQFWLIKCSVFIHSTTLYIHPRLDPQIEPKFYNCALCLFLVLPWAVGLWCVIVAISCHTHLLLERPLRICHLFC